MAPGAPPGTCPYCSATISAGAPRCERCGAVLDPRLGPGAGRVTTRERAPESRVVPGPDARRLVRGCGLLVGGLALAWIPVIGLIGAVLVLLAFYDLYAGRGSCDPETARRIVLGSNLFLATVVVAIAAEFASIPVGHLIGSGAATAAAWSTATGVVTTVLGVVCLIQFVGRFAPAGDERLFGLGLVVALGCVLAGGLVPEVTAVNRALLEPVLGSVAVSVTGGGVLDAIPYLWFAFLVLRCRRVLLGRIGR